MPLKEGFSHSSGLHFLSCFLQNNSISARLYLRFALETIWTEQINGLPSRASSEPSTFPQTDFHHPMSDAIAGSNNIFIHEGISYALFPDETVWRDKQKMLQERGYLLRPRFRPGWVPSWLNTNKRPLLCEDSLYNPVRSSAEYSS